MRCGIGSEVTKVAEQEAEWMGESAEDTEQKRKARRGRVAAKKAWARSREGREASDQGTSSRIALEGRLRRAAMIECSERGRSERADHLRADPFRVGVLVARGVNHAASPRKGVWRRRVWQKAHPCQPERLCTAPALIPSRDEPDRFRVRPEAETISTFARPSGRCLESCSPSRRWAEIPGLQAEAGCGRPRDRRP